MKALNYDACLFDLTILSIFVFLILTHLVIFVQSLLVEQILIIAPRLEFKKWKKNVTKV